MERVIHIVEPTLESEAGHCHSFVASLCGARGSDGPKLEVWAGRRARLPHLEGSGVTVHAFFRRRVRRLQEYILLSRLLRSPGRIFIATAGRTDLALLALAASGEIPPGKVFLYFHWVRPAPGKEVRLRRAAMRQPHLTLLAPTETVADALRRCGFGATRVVPYPITPLAGAPDAEPADFRRLLYAGAARQDKGFPALVDLVALLAERRRDLPVAVQASADHYDRYDPKTKADIARLEALRYPFLRIHRITLDPDAYATLFRGAICLQPYRSDDFADRVSGVTMDALSAGCPVVTTSGTWMARIVDRFGAGLVVDDPSARSLLEAADAIRADYGRYRDNALRAGRALQEENSARRLLAALAGD